jgi:hypothetical protein
MTNRYGAFNAMGQGNADMMALEQAGMGVMLQPEGYGPQMFANRYKSDEQVMQEAQQNMQSAQVGNSFDPNYQGQFTRSGPRRLGSPFRDGEIAYTSRAQALRDMGNTTEAAGIEAEQRARVEAVKERRREMDLPVGPAERRAARDQERQERLIRGQRQLAMRRGINQGSSAAAGYFPELYKATQAAKGEGRALSRGLGMGSPLTAAPDLKSPAGKQTAIERGQATRETSPLFPTLGLDPQARFSEFRDSFARMVRNEGPQSFDDGSLADAQEIIAGMSVTPPGEESQFEDHRSIFGNDPLLANLNSHWKSLGGLPRTQKARSEWYRGLLDKQQAILERQREGAARAAAAGEQSALPTTSPWFFNNTP